MDAVVVRQHRTRWVAHRGICPMVCQKGSSAIRGGGSEGFSIVGSSGGKMGGRGSGVGSEDFCIKGGDGSDKVGDGSSGRGGRGGSVMGGRGFSGRGGRGFDGARKRAQGTMRQTPRNVSLERLNHDHQTAGRA